MGRTRMGLAGAALGAMLLGGCGIVGGGDEPSVSPGRGTVGCGSPGAATAAPAELVDATATLARVAPAQPERLTYLPPTGDAAPALDQQMAQDPATVFDCGAESTPRRGPADHASGRACGHHHRHLCRRGSAFVELRHDHGRADPRRAPAARCRGGGDQLPAWAGARRCRGRARARAQRPPRAPAASRRGRHPPAQQRDLRADQAAVRRARSSRPRRWRSRAAAAAASPRAPSASRPARSSGCRW